MITVLNEQSETLCPSGPAEGDALWLSAEDLERATGWTLKPEGLCKGPVCVPITSRMADLVRPDAVNAAAFWRHMGHPVVHAATGDAWVLGTSAADRASALQSLEAPDFTLPDLAGQPGTLSQHRGKKVLLATWASW